MPLFWDQKLCLPAFKRLQMVINNNNYKQNISQLRCHFIISLPDLKDQMDDKFMWKVVQNTIVLNDNIGYWHSFQIKQTVW